MVVSLIIPAIRRQRQENHVQGQGLERGLSQEKAPGIHRNGKVQASAYNLSAWRQKQEILKQLNQTAMLV